uniref:Uncharacterized protein n=1 Tax=Candidatus Methanogaster sp. ANME-2c ERB4 TaxID=2759911 RepID=A0A7G9YGR0_9EURY|nr:hypothetical protein FLPJBPEJ_00038 [Methanosarcinales archaeon ANME-2c ERB4]
MKTVNLGEILENMGYKKQEICVPSCIKNGAPTPDKRLYGVSSARTG